MISGKRAFHGETSADTMSAILKEETPELSETARNVPAGLERIVRHCLEKNPSQRFHSASDLAFDLESLTEISGTSSKSGAQAAVREAEGAQSRRKLAVVAGAIVLAGALIGLGWWVGRGGGAAPPRSISRLPSVQVPSAMPDSLPTAASFTMRHGKAACTSYTWLAPMTMVRANWD